LRLSAPAGAASDMVSSHGKASAAPAPRSMVLREMGLNMSTVLPWIVSCSVRRFNGRCAGLTRAAQNDSELVAQRHLNHPRASLGGNPAKARGADVRDRIIELDVVERVEELRPESNQVL